MLIKQSYSTRQKSDMSVVLFSPGSAETNVGWGGKLNRHLMSSCVRNIRAKIYQNLVTGFQVTVENVNDWCFLGHSVYTYLFILDNKPKNKT